MRTLWTLLALAVVAGCYSKPTPIPVTGSPADLQQLAGGWSGEYRSHDGRRSGTITFQLAAGADSAYGDVVMIPQRWPTTGQMDRDSRMPHDTPMPEPLTIRFVRAESGVVSGSLAPYQDPECKCTVITRFEGHLGDRTIEGTYSSRHLDAPEGHTGTWKVTRAKS